MISVIEDIRLLESVSDLEAVRRLYERIWRTGANNPPVTADFLRALAKAGGYVSGAYEGDELVGACFGFFAPPAREALHSHIAGVLAQAQGRNVGFALKLHQRDWALARGAAEISWTYDPLIRRNAYFNLVKLGAEPTEYLPDFYGPMDDDVNRSDPTDRLFVQWRLASPEVEAACAGTPRAAAPAAAAAAPLLDIGPQGRPCARQTSSQLVRVAVPDDIETLRGQDPALAAEWRTALREVLGGLLGDGGRITGFGRTGWYIVERAA
ncbi:GNAT family N-acetyltransferase [Streptomyces laculatispora]|uniref:GNAT family N-acetyltransferase n=1 Tax=Streptomyces laculatispora TaxID=887464 RepID=UPI001F5F29DB|nr:GNAT family N-acetyltransferase [Streptomyces laculatispora]